MSRLVVSHGEKYTLVAVTNIYHKFCGSRGCGTSIYLMLGGSLCYIQGSYRGLGHWMSYVIHKYMHCHFPDFGFALQTSQSVSTTPCGSYSYAAPELFTSNGKPYDGKKADVWSL